MNDIEFSAVRGRATGDQLSNAIDEAHDHFGKDFENVDPLDTDAAREEHRKLLNWFFHEKDKQAANRLEMATDADFYDSIQYAEEDAAILRDRGQAPLVYNEVAPMVDWLIGTQRRAQMDWRILPRAEDDVKMADIKTKVMKFVSDVNRVPFVRSRAFADAIKSGVGWMDDGVRDDPTQDILYCKYEDWRNVLWDSASYEHDLSDARYIFRWRWVDEDVALMMFPKRKDQIRRAIENFNNGNESEEDTWYTTESKTQTSGTTSFRGTGSSQNVDTQRRRVKLIECQYRKPTQVKVVMDGHMRGSIANDHDQVMAQNIAAQGASLSDRMMMRVHFAVFTDADLIASGPSIYRHNRFGLTPIWCYRRGRDRLPYGAIRRVRDIQMDLNKRASKALFLLNTNQIIADQGAVDDWDELRDEVDRPDGLIIKNAGKELQIRRDTEGANGQIQMMTLAAQSIQKLAGVADENMGRQTNAVSGAAIQARQLQGSVVTTEPFDNLRLAAQIQGEKQLSLTEQFYTEEKVIRLTGSKGAIDWVRVNQPEVQADGSVRFLNDITASVADFIVSEQDYAGTLRQVMFDSLQQLSTRLPPEVSLRLMTMAMEFSDLPNKDEIADAIRKMTGDRDPNKEMTPEEAQQAQQQMQQQAEALEMQKQTAGLAMQEQQAKVREINAKAMKLEAEAQANAQAQGQPGIAPDVMDEINRIKSDASQQIDILSGELRKAQSDLANRTLQINREADTKLEAARIDQDTRIRIAEIQDASDKKIAMIEQRMAEMTKVFEQKLLDQEAKAAEKVAVPKEAAEPTAQPLPPMTFNVQVDAKQPVNKSIKFKRDKNGNITGAINADNETEIVVDRDAQGNITGASSIDKGE
ncbi:hypothetical protein ACO0K3_03725 [Undibacterium sp. Rencai35W]|uniref:portal protein n=1 Tax=Undibacterium sp. Rencai35W TaxID=3413046 RepID=UPI003BF21855